MIEVYISHTIGCTGWNIDEIYSHYPRFKKGARTGNYAKERGVKMLDFDFRQFQKHPDKVKERHIKLAREHDFDVIMSMDLWDYNIHECIKFTEILSKLCSRVLIPVHYFTEEILDFELAYPNANWFCQNIFPPTKYRDSITHVLGGSPQTQIRLILTRQLDLNGDRIAFPKIKSLDGNQIFNVAVHHGKYWEFKRPYWFKHEFYTPNEDYFIRSVKNLDSILGEIVR